MKTSLQTLFFLTFCLFLCKASYLPNSAELEQTEIQKKIIKVEKDCEEKFDILKKASLQAAELLKYAGEKIEAGIEHVNMAPQGLIDYSLKENSGKTRLVTRAQSRCGDWKPYKNEKCLKIATNAGLKTKEDAELVCKAFSEESNDESHPRLITIKTKKEQEFIQHFLFDEYKVVENVWLGLQKVGNTEDFEWRDGASVEYSNWAKQSIAGDKHQCVQMLSGQELTSSGEWVQVSCKKSNIVICEKTQIWTVDDLQHNFMNYKLEQDRKIEALEKETDNLKRNPVPLGFIYVQLATQDPPSTLWPQTKWTDVSSSYAGLFFRVVGGNAAPFGQIQEGDSSRLEEVYFGISEIHHNPVKIPSDGSWSEYFWNARDSSGTNYYQRFRLSGAEVRPRNQAMKIWKRIQ